MGGERRRDRRHGPGHGRDPRARLEPDFDPSRLRRPRRRRRSSKPLADPTQELPDPEPRRSPASIRRAPRSSRSPRSRRSRRGSSTRPSRSSAPAKIEVGDDKQVFKNWDPLEERADDAHDRARELVRHVLLRRRPCAPTTGRTRRSRSGRAAMGFGVATGIDLGPESDGLVPTPAWRKPPLQGPAREGLDERRLRPARDRPGRPARHAAPDDAPLRAARERRQARRAAHREADRAEPDRGRAAARRAAVHRAEAGRPRARPGRDPVVQRGALRGDARVVRNVHERRSRRFPSRSRARPARPRSSSSCPASQGCATSPGGAAGAVRRARSSSSAP